MPECAKRGEGESVLCNKYDFGIFCSQVSLGRVRELSNLPLLVPIFNSIKLVYIMRLLPSSYRDSSEDVKDILKVYTEVTTPTYEVQSYF